MKNHESKLQSEAGVALILTVMLLLLVSALGLSALQHAGDEKTVAASSRKKLSLVYAADAALSVASDQLLNGGSQYPTYRLDGTECATMIDPATANPMTWYNQDIDPDTPWQGSGCGMFADPSGQPVVVRTGTVDDPNPQVVARVGRTYGQAQQINVGAAGTTSWGVYRVGIVAHEIGGGRAQVQAQISIPEGSASYR